MILVYTQSLSRNFPIPLFLVFVPSYAHLSAQQHNNPQIAVTSRIDGHTISSWEPFSNPKALVLVWYNQVIVSLEDFWRLSGRIFYLISSRSNCINTIRREFWLLAGCDCLLQPTWLKNILNDNKLQRIFNLKNARLEKSWSNWTFSHKNENIIEFFRSFRTSLGLVTVLLPPSFLHVNLTGFNFLLRTRFSKGVQERQLIWVKCTAHCWVWETREAVLWFIWSSSHTQCIMDI